MEGPRTVFLGNDPWSAIALEACLDAEAPLEPVAVLTHTPKPAGRGSRLRPTAVADAALRLDLALIEVETIREGAGLEALRRTRPDVLAVVAYGELLPPYVLDLPALGCVNLHFSLLPRWRGATPVQRTIQAGDAVTGVTIILLDEGLDTGPVLARTEVSVDGPEDAGSLGARLAQLGGALLAPTIRSLHQGSLTPLPQAADGVSYAPKLAAGDRVVDWTRPAAVIDRWVRAVSPAPGAKTTFRGEAMKVVRGEPAPGRGRPGMIMTTDAASGRVEVGTGEGIYELIEVAPSGKKHLRADAWARGARFRPGERLGADQPGSDQPRSDQPRPDREARR